MKFTFYEKSSEKNSILTDDLKAYAEKKISKVERLFRDGGECDANIRVWAERGRYGVEVTLMVGGLFFRVSELTGDARASIDSAVAALERQARKHKTKISRRIRGGINEPELAAIPYLPDDGDDDESEFKISRTKRFAIKPMSVEEAILQMNLLGHQFFAFRNVDDGDAFAIVYVRKDGSYGQITSAED
ncbi:MAG: ribosome-associated translation inhibitor RaiA [Oscillospiraceae bacterium]|jgi:putative sigma-54 modulation protein|nr:ribosome-associated translation inhibitor RaiA [Oscillospiraceae bacterium]